MRSVLGLVPLILASCATGSAPTPAPVNDEAGSVCRAGSADRFLGQTATADPGDWYAPEGTFPPMPNP